MARKTDKDRAEEYMQKHPSEPHQICVWAYCRAPFLLQALADREPHELDWLFYIPAEVIDDDTGPYYWMENLDGRKQIVKFSDGAEVHIVGR